MDYKKTQSELVTHLRGKRTQQRLADKLGWNHNKIYLIESGKAQLEWNDFVRLCEVSKIDAKGLFKKAFGFVSDIHNHKQLVKHFIGQKKHAEVAQEMKVSSSTISRWVSGLKSPHFAQMLQLIDTYTMDYYLFLTSLTGDKILPSLEKEVKKANAYSSLYTQYPWLSLLFSAMGTSAYEKNPTSTVLSQQIKIPVKLIDQCLKDLASQNLLHWDGQAWESRLPRIRLRASIETRHKTDRYLLKRVHDSIHPSLELPHMKYSWKIFNLNQKNFDKIYQKYVEFFNELGRLIDDDHKSNDSDKIYIFTAALLDAHNLVEHKED